MPDPLYIYTPLTLMIVWTLSFAARTLWVWKTTGENPNKIKHDDSIMSFCGRIYGVTGVALSLYVTLRVFYPSLDSQLGVITYLSHTSLAWLGLTLAISGTIFSIISQIYMAKSWRIGIPDDAEGEKPGELVSGGPFRISRNPFFTGLIFYYLGLFLMLPNALTLTVIITIWAVLNVQIRLEEDFLERTIGAPYSSFKATVRRWI